MKRLLEKIKLDRIINNFLSQLNVENGFYYEEYTYCGDSSNVIYISKKSKYCNIYVSDISELTGLEYNKYLVDKIISFINIGDEYKIRIL